MTRSTHVLPLVTELLGHGAARLAVRILCHTAAATATERQYLQHRQTYLGVFFAQMNEQLLECSTHEFRRALAVGLQLLELQRIWPGLRDSPQAHQCIAVGQVRITSGTPVHWWEGSFGRMSCVHRRSAATLLQVRVVVRRDACVGTAGRERERGNSKLRAVLASEARWQC